jgi:hypothetical protein
MVMSNERERSGKKARSVGEPEILEMKPQKMAVVYTKGDPSKVAEEALPALYGSVYKLKFELKRKGVTFKVGKLRARWPDAHLLPKDQWAGIWGLPVPEDTTSLPQKVPEIEVKVETWNYGTVAQILHVGPYGEEEPSVKRLHDFIFKKGYDIAGVHEEEYLTTPKAKVQKTLIRYPIRKKARSS